MKKGSVSSTEFTKKISLSLLDLLNSSLEEQQHTGAQNPTDFTLRLLYKAIPLLDTRGGRGAFGLHTVCPWGSRYKHTDIYVPTLRAKAKDEGQGANTYVRKKGELNIWKDAHIDWTVLIKPKHRAFFLERVMSVSFVQPLFISLHELLVISFMLGKEHEISLSIHFENIFWLANLSPL